MITEEDIIKAISECNAELSKKVPIDTPFALAFHMGAVWAIGLLHEKLSTNK